MKMCCRGGMEWQVAPSRLGQVSQCETDEVVTSRVAELAAVDPQEW